jgi:hypothetical protein
MTEETRKFVEEKVRALIDASSCCSELKTVAGNWLKNEKTSGEKSATEALMQELEEDVMPLTDTLAFFRSENAEKYFGRERAAALVAAAEKAQAAGEKYCICDACQAGAAILKRKNEILA